MKKDVPGAVEHSSADIIQNEAVFKTGDGTEDSAEIMDKETPPCMSILVGREKVHRYHEI